MSPQGERKRGLGQRGGEIQKFSIPFQGSEVPNGED